MTAMREQDQHDVDLEAEPYSELETTPPAEIVSVLVANHRGRSSIFTPVNSSSSGNIAGRTANRYRPVPTVRMPRRTSRAPANRSTPARGARLAPCQSVPLDRVAVIGTGAEEDIGDLQGA
jgi:hypothetical protein